MKTKVITAVICAIALVAVSVMGTAAYFTSKDAVKNTFTSGDIEIILDEADVDEYGVKETENRVKTNDYKIIPGHKYIKDPTVTVKAGSEEAYIRLLVTVGDIADVDALFAAAGGADMTAIFANYDPAVWVSNGSIKDDVKNTRTFEFRYKTTVDTLDGKDLVLEPLFDAFTVPADINNAGAESIKEMTIDVAAQAIQADTFADADAAWAAF